MENTREGFYWMPTEEWVDLKRSILDPDYWEYVSHVGKSVHYIDAAWKEAEKNSAPSYSEDHMWDVANQFGSYGEYMEWLEHLEGTKEEFERNELYFEYHHLL